MTVGVRRGGLTGSGSGEQRCEVQRDDSSSAAAASAESVDEAAPRQLPAADGDRAPLAVRLRDRQRDQVDQASSGAGRPAGSRSATEGVASDVADGAGEPGAVSERYVDVVRLDRQRALQGRGLQQRLSNPTSKRRSLREVIDVAPHHECDERTTGVSGKA
jgi:hypothetical protein